jgi:hypothetical protein
VLSFKSQVHTCSRTVDKRTEWATFRNGAQATTRFRKGRIDAFPTPPWLAPKLPTRTDSPENKPVLAEVRRVCQLGSHSATKLASSLIGETMDYTSGEGDAGGQVGRGVWRSDPESGEIETVGRAWSTWLGIDCRQIDSESPVWSRRNRRSCMERSFEISLRSFAPHVFDPQN